MKVTVWIKRDNGRKHFKYKLLHKCEEQLLSPPQGKARPVGQEHDKPYTYRPKQGPFLTQRSDRGDMPPSSHQLRGEESMLDLLSTSPSAKTPREHPKALDRNPLLTGQGQGKEISWQSACVTPGDKEWWSWDRQESSVPLQVRSSDVGALDGMCIYPIPQMDSHACNHTFYWVWMLCIHQTFLSQRQKIKVKKTRTWPNVQHLAPTVFPLPQNFCFAIHV